MLSLQNIRVEVELAYRKKYYYLGVEMEFNEDRTLSVSMITYLKNVIAGSRKRSGQRQAAQLRITEARVLEEERALAVHHTVAQLLFMCTRARQDMQTAVAFLTTRVKVTDEDNWGKLKWVLKYLNRMKYLKLTLSVENFGMLKWYVDGYHNVHTDCHKHRGAVFTLGREQPPATQER